MDIAKMNTPKGALERYFNVAHEAVLWKIADLSEYDLRRPMTLTGTNLLGLVKHLAIVETGYFGSVFGGEDLAVMPDEPNADMFAAADESSEEIVALFRQVWAASQVTIERLDLDSEGYVPWWGEAGNPVTLARIMVHMATEIYRHLGQMDIVRENIDGAVGMRQGAENVAQEGDFDWAAHRQRLETIASQFAADA